MQLGLTDIDFKDIETGKKIVEVRAPSNSKNYAKLSIGDEIIFINETTQEKLTKKLRYIHFYHTAQELYHQEKVENINPGLTTEAALEKLFSIPTYKERIEIEGVYAIGIE